ncbi:hypothetical protein LIPSTDRAFT_76475 [Lipomyces starkeyi NRRL Y-11557]|uniref:Uncharacterized protein n=1 Tax=Lipomyces starkeyi NRRL Y-11557 TaxID=675824 RepID=A0A1E3PUI9_LIPST|nr:hypothetical protein LIPSTDRAFT_76475 [Lipomyces starkeyi NRRL Y-11557]
MRITYINRLTHVVEMQNAKTSIMRKQMEDAAEVLQARKVRRRSKRVQLQRKFWFSTEVRRKF